jgi:hypothetical protein
VKLTAQDLITSDGKYPKRIAFITPTLQQNAERFTPKALALLEHYGVRLPINSGFRDPEANRKAGGSATSSHCECRAIDFSDKDGKFAAWCLKNTGLLAALKLYIEDPAFTKGWVHVTDRAPRSGKVVFKP